MGIQKKFNENVMECLLFLLQSPRITGDTLERLLGRYPSREDYEQDMRAADYLKQFIDEMPGGFLIYHADGDEEIIYANEAMCRILECDSLEEFRQLTGNSFRGIVHPEEVEEVERSINAQIKDSEYSLDHVEYRSITKNGEIRWMDDYGHFVRSEIAGDVFYVFVGNTTGKRLQQMKMMELMRHENDLREEKLRQIIGEYDQELKLVNQEYLRGLEMIEGLSIDYESIFYIDLDKDQIKAYRVSNRFIREFPKDNMVQKFTGFDNVYVHDWVHPDDRESIRKITQPDFFREKLSKDSSFHINYRIIQDGKLRYMQMRMVNVGSTEHISQIVLGYRNVDAEIVQEMEQKQILEETLQIANKAIKAKDLFLSNMSHDIRTPMNAIVGFTDLVQKHLHDKDKVKGYLNQIEIASAQLLCLLNDVLEISNLESGESIVEETSCSLMEIAHQVQRDMLQKAAAKNITVSLDVFNLAHDHVYVDRPKLSQVLLRLLDNAVKFTQNNGNVTVTVEEQESLQEGFADYLFRVEDNGIGIGREFLSQIFMPFEREKNTTLSGMYGTGLGLAITRRFVEMMGGKIDVSSIAGKGSIFTVSISLHIDKEEQQLVDEMQIQPEGYSTEQRRILIVDDNEINLEIEYEVLKDVGYLVETAEDGSIAVEKVKQSSPGYYDLILMDIQMPIMDGYSATKAIRQIENPALAGIPIIAVSANAFEEDKRMAIESGMNAHLAKPLDTLRLYQLIRKFLKEALHTDAEETNIPSGKEPHSYTA